MNRMGWITSMSVLLSVLCVSEVLAQDPPLAAQDRGWGPPPRPMGGWGGGPMANEMRGRCFEALDTDGDGRIDKDEFIDRGPQVMQRFRQRGQQFQQARPFQQSWGGQMGGMNRPRVPAPSTEDLSQIIEKAVREALQQQREPMLPGPQSGPRPKGYGFQQPGPDRDLRGPGPQHGTRQFDRPYVRSGGAADTPQMRGHGFRGGDWQRGREQAGPWKKKLDPGPGREDRRSQQPGRTPGARPQFNILDADRDGKIQKTEIQRVRDILSRVLDQAGERDLTKQEFADLARDLFPGRGGDTPKTETDKPQGDKPK